MKSQVIAATVLVGGILATAAPAQAIPEAEPLTYGHCVADGVIDPQIDFVGPRTVVNGHVNYPEADEPPGQHWEYFWGCS